MQTCLWNVTRFKHLGPLMWLEALPCRFSEPPSTGTDEHTQPNPIWFGRNLQLYDPQEGFGI